VIVSQIWRYPVKSIGGERLESADVGELGIAGDRGWGVVDRSTGMVLTARRAPQLLFASARVDPAGPDPAVVITLPTGREVTIGASGDAELSEWLELDVELRRAGDTGGTYENPLNVEDEDDWVTWQGPAGAWHDSPRSRLSLVSESTLGQWDIRRFRTNVLVSGRGEDEFVDSAIEVGSCRLDITQRIDRCIMVTRPQPGLDRDLGVLQAVHRERSSCVSIGALVARAGVISVGDKVLAAS
jgi:uncharacterized protein